MTITISFKTATFIVLCLGAIQFLVTEWTKARLQYSIKSEYDKIIEEYRFDLKAREQAAKVSEYVALYHHDPNNFLKMNQLSFELFLWLPEDIYKNLGKALIREKGAKNLGEILVDIRKILLKDKAEHISDDDLIVHGKDIGKSREQTHEDDLNIENRIED